MRRIFVIAGRDVRAYFRSPVAYVFLTTFLALNAFLFFRSFFLIGQASMQTFFILMPWVFLFYVPAIAMGQWSEELRQGTSELLLTLPVPVRELVIGKFLAGMVLLSIALLGTVPIAYSVDLLGPLDWGTVLGGYLGLLSVGGVYLALGLVVSAMTKNQIVAFIVSVLASFVLLVIGEPIMTMVLPTAYAQIVQNFGVSFHFGSMSRGVLDSRDILYFVSIIGFCLWMNCQMVKGRRV